MPQKLHLTLPPHTPGVSLGLPISVLYPRSRLAIREYFGNFAKTIPRNQYYMNPTIDNLNGARRRHPIIANILLAIIVLLLFGWLIMVFLDLWTHHGATSVVPDIRYMSYDKAISELSDSKLNIEISDSVFMSDIDPANYDRPVKPGMVLESWPKAGAVVKRNRQVYVTIVAFSPKEVTLITPLENISSRQAMSILQGLGVNNVRVVHVPSLYNDNVERATYDGKPVTVGSSFPVNATITLEVGQSADENYEYAMPADGSEPADKEVAGSGAPAYIDGAISDEDFNEPDYQY